MICTIAAITHTRLHGLVVGPRLDVDGARGVGTAAGRRVRDRQYNGAVVVVLISLTLQVALYRWWARVRLLECLDARHSGHRSPGASPAHGRSRSLAAAFWPQLLVRWRDVRRPDEGMALRASSWPSASSARSPCASAYELSHATARVRSGCAGAPGAPACSWVAHDFVHAPRSLCALDQNSRRAVASSTSRHRASVSGAWRHHAHRSGSTRWAEVGRSTANWPIARSAGMRRRGPRRHRRGTRRRSCGGGQI